MNLFRGLQGRGNNVAPQHSILNGSRYGRVARQSGGGVAKAGANLCSIVFGSRQKTPEREKGEPKDLRKKEFSRSSELNQRNRGKEI